MKENREEINQGIDCILITDKQDPALNRVEQTYVDSFPADERRDFLLVRELIETPAFHVFLLCKDGNYAGFITLWQWADFAYIEHFAIDEAARNGGIGREALARFLAQLNTPVVLEVEMPTDEMSRRRIGFYQRLGFILDEHAYQQPPYRPGESWLDMRLMSYGPLNLDQHYEKVKATLYREVYCA